jgi:hypothetical protein
MNIETREDLIEQKIFKYPTTHMAVISIIIIIGTYLLLTMNNLQNTNLILPLSTGMDNFNI